MAGTRKPVIVGVILLMIAVIVSVVLLTRTRSPKPAPPPSKPALTVSPGSPLAWVADPDPARLWLTRQCFRGLFRYGEGDRLEPELAQEWSGRLRVRLSPSKTATLPSGVRATAGGMKNYLDMIQARKKDARLGGLLKIEAIEGGRIQFEFSPIAPESPEALTEILGHSLMSGAEVRQILIIKLKKDRSWDLSHPITARDAVFTFEKIKNIGIHSRYTHLFRDITSVRSLDDHTLEVTASRVSYPSLEAWTIPLLPEFFYRDHSLDEWPQWTTEGHGLHRPLAEWMRLHGTERDPPKDSVPVTLPFHEKLIVGFNLTDPDLQSDGVRKNLALAAGGKPVRPMKSFTLEVICSQTSEDASRESEKLVSSWKPAGIQARLLKLDPKQFQERLASRRYQAFIGTLYDGWSLGPETYVEPAAWPAGLNYFAYTEPEVGRLVQRLRTTFDPAKRKELRDIIDKRILQDIPCIVLHQRPATLTLSGSLAKLLKNR